MKEEERRNMKEKERRRRRNINEERKKEKQRNDNNSEKKKKVEGKLYTCVFTYMHAYTAVHPSWRTRRSPLLRARDNGEPGGLAVHMYVIISRVN